MREHNMNQHMLHMFQAEVFTLDEISESPKCPPTDMATEGVAHEYVYHGTCLSYGKG